MVLLDKKNTETGQQQTPCKISSPHGHTQIPVSQEEREGGRAVPTYLGQGGEQEDPVGQRLGPGQLDGAGDLLDGLQHDLLGARLHRGCRRRRQGDHAEPARPQPADGGRSGGAG